MQYQMAISRYAILLSAKLLLQILTYQFTTRDYVLIGILSKEIIFKLNDKNKLRIYNKLHEAPKVLITDKLLSQILL